MSLVAFSKLMLSARRRWVAPALMLVAYAGLAVSLPRAEAAQVELDGHEGQLPPRASAAVAVLRDEASTPQQRLDAAAELIALSEHGAVKDALEQLLQGSLVSNGEAVLDAIEALPDAPVRLFPMVTQRLAGAEPEEVARIIPALGSFRIRDSVRILGRYLTKETDEAAAKAAMASLSRLSARDDIPATREAWLGFVNEVQQISDSQWRLRLISALAAREQRGEAQRREAVGQLVESLRQLHLATKPEARPTFLASLLQNDMAEVRRLGFELVRRELSATGQIDGPVGAAALALLRHSDPGVRGSAAVLVRQLAPDGSGEAIAVALAGETDPSAAADLLLAAARWPSSEVARSVLKWIKPGTAATDAAFEAAWWLHRAGQLSGDTGESVLAALREVPDGYLSPAGVSLLSALGTTDDRARIVPLLQSPAGAVRQAAGEALVWYPEFSQAILNAAGSDPDLFELAARAVLVNEPTEESVAQLLRLPMPSSDIAQRAILRAANGLSASELLGVANQATPALRRALLNQLTSPYRLMSEKADPDMLRAIAQGAVELADLELGEGQPEAALAVLDDAPYADPLVDAERLGSLRCAALIGVGQFEVAQGLKVPASAWLRGLELFKDSPDAGRVVQEIERRFGSTLTPEQKAQVEAVKQAIEAEDAAKKAAQRTRPLPPQ